MVKTHMQVRNNLTGTEGIVWGEGTAHQEQRTFMINTMKSFGFGKSYMEPLINDEVLQFCDGGEDVIISAINEVDVSLYLIY